MKQKTQKHEGGFTPTPTEKPNSRTPVGVADTNERHDFDLRSFLFMKKKNTSRSVWGFTLVELMVAMGLFGILITVAVGGFTNVLRAQKQATLLLAANSNVSLALEQMAREMRTGYNFCQGPNLCTSNHRIGFTNAAGEGVRYCFRQVGVIGSLRRGSAVGGIAPICDASSPITGDNVNIVDFSYVRQGEAPGDGYPPRITMSVTASPTDPSLAGVFFTIQTTVSARLILDS